jgi:hypothetical protein
MGSATWELIDTRARLWEEDPEKAMEQELSAESLARLRERMLYWLSWQETWAVVSYATAAVSLILLAFRRNILSVAACLISLTLAVQSFSLTKIRF